LIIDDNEIKTQSYKNAKIYYWVVLYIKNESNELVLKRRWTTGTLPRTTPNKLIETGTNKARKHWILMRPTI